METENKPVNANASNDNADRIVLRRVENDLLHDWVSALNERFDGMIRVTKSDLANFLIRQHSEKLTEDEIKLIEAELFDEVRWLNWALAKIRQAKKEGRALSLEELMRTTRPVDGKKTVSNRSVQKRKKGVPATAEPLDPQPIGEASPANA